MSNTEVINVAMMPSNNNMLMDEPPQQIPINVCLRIRPLNKFEKTRRSTHCLTTSSTTNNNNENNKVSYASVVGKQGLSSSDNNTTTNKNETIKIDSPLEGELNFTFDKVYHENNQQLDIYQQTVQPLATHVMEGYNCALIAYGHTGSGKTYTMMGSGRDHHVLPTTTKKSSTKKSTSGTATTSNVAEDDTKSGMIHLLINEIFQLINTSQPTTEYIVRCSFVEIYLEKVLDLLNPTNRGIQILSSSSNSSLDDNNGGGGLMEGAVEDSNNNNDTGGGGGGGGGVRLHGASEACCFDKSDVISLLMRGNACRTVSSTKMNTDSSRSHAIFIMKIEQKDNITGISKVSQLQMIDMAGSELAGKLGGGGGGMDNNTNTSGAAIHQEGTMINKSISLLHTAVKQVVENQKSGSGESGEDALVDDDETAAALYKQSKLTHLLRDVFGGNCRTSIILTTSPASYNISETIRTLKFGQLCQSIHNYVRPSVEMSPLDYRKLLNDSQKKQGDLVNLVNELSAECFQLKQDAKKDNFVESQYDGPLWKTIESVLVNGATPAVIKSSSSRGQGGSNDMSSNSNNNAALQEDLRRTREELESSRQLSTKLENLLAERQSEVAVLRTQNDIYTSEKKKDLQELVSMKNEMRLLTQRKQEVEHNLRTSQFREYEATVFLRQFRRFYRRLLRNKAHQGTGRTLDVIEKVPGVPDLNDLIDVDSLLLEAGLIEESELHDDTATGAYRPSAAALSRSTDATNKAWKEAALHGKVDELESFDRSSLGGQRQISDSAHAPHGQAITNRQQFLGTPAGRLTTMRERELERDLLRATERCIELQVALNEEKANVDVLTNRAGNTNKKKFAQESIQLKQQLDKKTHDLQAIIWKMNELHLINKTYNEKMSNREQHVTYLEENLVELQSSNRNMILERQEAEGHLRGELDNLKVLVDAMTVPLWQFGECGVTGRTLESRIRLPVSGGEIDENEEPNADGSESLESEEESVVSDDEEGGDESEYEEELELQDEREVVDASTQTAVAHEEKGTMTDTDLTPMVRDSNADQVSGRNDLVSSQKARAVPQSIDRERGNQTYAAPRSAGIGTNGYHASGGQLFRGGMPAGSKPRRFVPKYGLMIRPGVLKESSSTSKVVRKSGKVS